MANEAAIRDRFSNPMDWTVADGTALAKGAIVAASDLRTVAAISSGAAVAGIMAREKIASDGRTQVAVFYDGVFDVIASGAVTVGDSVSAANGNYVYTAVPSALKGAKVMGTALETAANNEVFQIKLSIGSS